MTSKKVMIMITIMSLLIVVVVVMIVHNGKSDETETIPITADSVAIGSWATENPGTSDAASSDSESSEKTMNEVELTLDGDGTATGTFGKYDFKGTWQQLDKFSVQLVNKNGDAVYKGVIDPDDEEKEKPVMDLAAIDVTDSMTWTLVKQ